MHLWWSRWAEWEHVTAPDFDADPTTYWPISKI